jgi:hypothetical protein
VARRYQRDVCAKDTLWIQTSTKNPEKGYLFDVFDLQGRYVDMFYLKTGGRLLAVEETPSLSSKGLPMKPSRSRNTGSSISWPVNLFCQPSGLQLEAVRELYEEDVVGVEVEEAAHVEAYRLAGMIKNYWG